MTPEELRQKLSDDALDQANFKLAMMRAKYENNEDLVEYTEEYTEHGYSDLFKILVGVLLGYSLKQFFG